MPRFVIGLEHDGHQLRNEIRVYIQESGQPNDLEHLEMIYSEIVSQVVHVFNQNFHEFMLDLMMVPNFSTISYIEEKIDFDLIRRFGDQVRAFGVRLWNHYYPKLSQIYTDPSHGGIPPNYVVVMESVTPDYLVLNAYESLPAVNDRADQKPLPGVDSEQQPF